MSVDSGDVGEEDTSPMNDTCDGVDRFNPDTCEDLSRWRSCIIHVDNMVDKSGDGSTWENAFKTIQEGIDIAKCGFLTSNICPSWQVWVAHGNYYIHQGCKTDTVRMRSNVEVYGGFQSGMEALSKRNPDKFKTILHGTNEIDEDLRVYHVVTANEDAVIDGLTIQGGRAEHPSNFYHQQGGGMYIHESSAVVDRCRFLNNSARNNGAAITVESGELAISESDFNGNTTLGDGAGIAAWDSKVRVTDCLFEENAGFLGSGAVFAHSEKIEIEDTVFRRNSSEYGPAAIQLQLGAIVLDNVEFTDNQSIPLDGFNSQDTVPQTIGGTLYCVRGTLKMSSSRFEANFSAGERAAGLLSSRCEVAISDTVFLENHGSGKGGGAYFSQSPGTVDRCSFLSNTADQGGGVFLGFTDTILTNTVLAGNSATIGGAAVIHSDWPKIVNSTITRNTATSVAGGIAYLMGTGRVENSILFDNQPEDISYWDFEDPPLIFRSIVGRPYGEDNIFGDPLFVDGAGGDFHLRKESPCIDQANGVAPDYDFEGNARFDHPQVENQGDGGVDFADIGAFEYVE